MKKIGLILLFVFITVSLISCGIIGLEPPPEDEGDELTVEYVYQLAAENGYEGTLEDFIDEFKGEAGEAGADGIDGIGIESVTVNQSGHLIIKYTNSKIYDAGLVIFTPDYDKITPSIGENGNWYIGGEDTGVPSNAGEGSEWYTGTALPLEELGFDGDFYISTSTLNVYYKDGTWGLVGSVSGSLGGTSGEMSQAAISRALLSSVSIFCQVTSTEYQTGSGVIYKLDKSAGDAYIITNHHVVYNENSGSIFNNSSMFVYLYGMEHDQYAIPAKYVGGSRSYDIAILKVSGSDVIKNSNARSAVVADSDNVSVLDSVVAVGNPLSQGISATRGAVNVESEYVDNGSYSPMRVMRVDAPVNQGNSGGGLFNTNGELVGIVDAKIIDEAVDNVAYVIPSNVAVRLVDNILYYCDGTSRVNGKFVSLGITLELFDVTVKYDEVTEKLTKLETVTIAEIASSSYAASAGLKVGDIIISITVDGEEYHITKLYQPGETRLLLRPESSVVYKINRGGEELNKTVELPSQVYYVNIE